MFEPDIAYIPSFGVEPFSNVENAPEGNFGGGAVNTHGNLLVTLWTTAEGDAGVPLPDKLIRPLFDTPIGDIAAASFTSLGAQTTAKTLAKTAFNSRTSCRFYLGFETDTYSYPLLGIMNCPPDLRNELLLSCKKLKDGSFQYNSDLTASTLAWTINARSFDAGSGFYFCGGPTVECSMIAPIPILGAPLFKTDGSNGQAPELVPFNIDASFTGAAFEYMLNNPFYVGVYIYVEAERSVVDIAWPHSAGRLS